MDDRQIQEAVREKYRKVARTAEGVFGYATGQEGARALGYDAQAIADAPPELMASFCGVGNPLSLGPVRSGETILDVGCGAGFDVYVASRILGEDGLALGLDLTPEMVSVAQQNLARAGVRGAEVRHGTSEALPYESATVDVAVSNGVFNLSPNKHRTFEEVFRVLRPGGRLQFADIVLDEDLPGDVVGSLEAWSN
ncbi:MAG: methyltransferase domain-containing protein [Candidatus Eisenbacteria bacterium]